MSEISSADNSLDGIWRDGNLLVVAEGTVLPRYCPKCDAPVAGPSLMIKNIRRQGKGMIGAAVADQWDKAWGSNYVGPVRMIVYFCPRHRRLRLLLVLVSLALMLVGPAGAWACWLVDPKNGMNGVFFFPLAVGLGGFAGIYTTLMGENPWFKPKKFDDRYVWLKGACRAFLDRLPNLP